MLRQPPAAIKNLSQLERLELPLNALAVLPPDELATLRHLRPLDLTDNECLAEIDPLASRTQLQELYLYGCYLEKLPANTGKLKNLQTLGLTGNNLSPLEQSRTRKALPNCAIFF